MALPQAGSCCHRFDLWHVVLVAEDMAKVMAVP